MGGGKALGWRAAWMLALAMLVTGCGGGAGGGDGDRSGDRGGDAPGAGVTGNGAAAPGGGAAPADPTAPVAALNGSDAGVLYYSAAGGDGGFWVGLDMASGLPTSLRSHSGSSAAPSGEEFVGIESTSSQMLEPDRYSTELHIFDRSGRSVARFGRASFMHGPRLSHDGQRLAFEYHDIDAGDAGGVDILNITDRSGRVLARYEGMAWWDWLPDGRLLAAGGDALYLIDAGLGPARVLRRFAGDAPADLSVSPDGQRVALTLGDRGALANHVYVMNVDGSGLRQVTTSGLNEDAPAWSPDGKRLAVRQGIAYSALSAGIPGHTCPTVWVLPADATAAPLSGDAAAKGTTPARELRMRDGEGTRGVCAFSRLYWRASPAALPAAAGTALAGGGLNQGLSGQLFYDEPVDMVSVDLASGARRRWPGRGGSPFPSADGSEIAFSADEPDSGNRDEQQISFLRADGSFSARAVVTGGSLGGLAVTRDLQRFVLRLNTEDTGGHYPLTVFDRQGRRLARAPDRYGQAAWHPDGRLLLVGSGDLAISNLALTALSPVASMLDAVSDPAWSPDGSRLAFAMAGHIWVMNADGSGLRQLTVSALEEHSPAWSPDGRVLIVAQREVCSTAWAVPADGQRVWVGQPALPSTAVAIRRQDADGTRNMCLFSQPQWR